ncbi:MAG: NTP transferase domain-containing protein [Planctomycetes bacterium]|nr:NTP transferase domain-containing protein [Planctomycetota bacterium]
MSSPQLMGVILAAGKGTRMRPFSEHYPKPILPLGGKPLIAHQLEILASLGVEHVIVVIGHLGHEVVRELGDGEKFGLRLTYVEQTETLGIAHAVYRLEKYVDRPFFLFLGDIYFEIDNLATMPARMMGPGGADGVLAVKREKDPEKIRRNFVVLTDANGRVHRVVEKPRYAKTDLKGCGIYLFDQSFFDAVRRTPRTAMRDEYEITDAIQIYIEDGYRVEAAEVVQDDLNLSYPLDLLDLNLHWLDKHGARNMIGRGVQLASGARVERSLLMDGVVIEKPIELRDCLVFPNVRVRHDRDLRRAILTNETEIIDTETGG